MAKIELSEIGTDIRGSTGGNTYSRNTGGLFVRSRIKPINKHTPYTGRQRTTLAYLARLWSNMSSTDQEVWNAAATPPQKGYQLFQLQNQTAAKLSLTVTTSPVTPAAITPVPFTLDFDVSGFTMSITPATIGPGNIVYYVSASPPLSAGKETTPSSVRFIGVYPSGSGQFDIVSEYITKFGFIPPVGCQISISFQVCDTNAYNCLIPIFASAITY